MKKGSFKYYLVTFGLVFLFILIMLIMSHSQGLYLVSSQVKATGVWSKTFSIFLYKEKTFIIGNYLLDVLALIGFPVGFGLVFFGIDKLSYALKSKKKKEAEKEKEQYETFIDDIGAELNRVKKFNVEDFRHFRENEKMQECLKKLYFIYRDGETENNNYELVLRKFKKNTVERDAIEYLVSFTQERILKRGKKEEVNE